VNLNEWDGALNDGDDRGCMGGGKSQNENRDITTT